MDNEILQDIVDYARMRLIEKYGYCGVASGDDMAMITTADENGNDIKIDISVKPE